MSSIELVSNLESNAGSPSPKFDDFNKLLDLPGKLKRIWAISAYYDPESIDQLIKYMDDHGSKRSKIELIIVLDRRVRVDDKLKELDECIRGKFKSCYSGIYLSSRGVLFHSKGYLVESQTDGKCAVGSLNLTRNGLTRNAELLAVSHYKIDKPSKFAEDFKKYVDDEIWSDDKRFVSVSDPKMDEKMPPRTFRDFFLAGRLGYEANGAGLFGFKLYLPDGSLEAQPVNRDVADILEAKTLDILDVRKLIGPLHLELRQAEEKLKEKEKKEGGSSNSKWRNYCFQTCYGYWAPSCFFSDIKEEINKKKSRAELLKKTFDALEEKKEQLWTKLLEICQGLAPTVGKGWGFVSENGCLNKDKLEGRWSRWFENHIQKKNEKEFISRLCREVQFVRMPDIWEDKWAVEDFKDSFKNSFLYEKNRNQSKNHLFWFFEFFPQREAIFNAMRRLADGGEVSRIMKELEQPMLKRHLQPHLNALVAQGRLVQKVSRQGARRYCLSGAQSDDLSLEKRIHDWLQSDS